jgi:hypothetical protein
MIRAFLALLLFVAPVSAETYYVDYETGSESNTGTSTGSPWKYCPGDTRSAKTLVAGDNVYFKAGTTYQSSGSITLTGGTVGNPITYDGDQWGSGADCIFTGGHTASVVCFTDGGEGASGKSNIVMRDMTITRYGGYDENDPMWTPNNVTVDIGTDVFTAEREHTLAVNDDIRFIWTGTIPGGLNGQTAENGTLIYYVNSVPSPTTFTISTTLGGATRDITSNSSTTLSVWEPLTSTPGGEGIRLTSGSSDNITITNVSMSKIGQWNNLPPLQGGSSVGGIGIKLQNNDNVTITGGDFTQISNPVSIKAFQAGGTISNIVVDGLDIHNYITWGVDVAPRSTGAIIENVTIKNCKIHDIHEYDLGNWEGFGQKPHTDGIFLRTSNTASTWTNLRIHSNSFYADDWGNSQNGTSHIYISEGPSALIYNNVFKQGKFVSSIGVGHNNYVITNQVVRIYNNTFVNAPTPVQQTVEDRIERRATYVANNLFYTTSSSSTSPTLVKNEFSDAKFMELDYNLYYNPNFTAAQLKPIWVNTGVASYKYATLANAQTVSQPIGGFYETNGDYGNPLLTDTSGPFLEMDFRPLAGSAVIGEGVNLSEYFTTDKDGNARPASGAWDVGAYVSGVSAPADVTAPTLTSAGVDSEGDNVILTFSEPVQNLNLSHYAISGHSLSSLTGSGTTWAFTISPIRQAGADFNMTYTSGAGRTADIAGNLFASGTYTVANGSLAATPDPPIPGRRGGGAKRLLRR